MKLNEVLKELESFGTEQTRKIYRRHGAEEPMFGVKFGDLTKLRKEIGIDHPLAEQLWDTGNSDARTLALMVVDLARVSSAQIDKWLSATNYGLLVGMLAGDVVPKTKYAESKWKKWSKAKSERSLSAAYALLSGSLRLDADSVSPQILSDALSRIENDIAAAPNLARHAMNNALIAIGIYRAANRKQALRIAKAIGKVQVDHGETSCKRLMRPAISRKRSHGKRAKANLVSALFSRAG